MSLKDCLDRNMISVQRSIWRNPKKRDLFIIPTLASLAERSNGFLSVAVLRWLLHVPQDHSTFRRLRKFVGSHTCLHCHDLFAQQEHIASFRARLCHCECIDFDLLTYSNRSIIEHALLLVSQELIFDQHGATKVLEFTVAAILECLKTTIGDNWEY
jgi:hypothetical protein